MTDRWGAAAPESPPPRVGTAWGCPVCHAEGPLMTSPCPYCEAEVAPVLLTARKEALRLFNQGLEAARGGFWNDGIELVWQALDLAGPDSGGLSLYGLLLHQVGRTPEALAAWRQAGGLDSAPVWLDQAEESSQGDLAAVEAYNAALLSAGWGQWEHALKRIEPATAPGSRLAVAFVVKGLAAWALGNRGTARAAWERAMELDPSAPGLQACMVAMLDEVMAEARRAVRAVPGQSEPDSVLEPGFHTPVSPAAAALFEVAPDVISGVGDEERTALRTEVPPPPARGRSWWVPAVVALLMVASAGSAGYLVATVRSESAIAEALADQQDLDAARSAQVVAEGQAARSQAAARSAEAAAAAAEGVRAQAQAALSQAEETARQAAQREGVALQLLAVANPDGAAGDLERLLTLAEEARRLRLPVPDWVDRSLAAVRTRAAVERYFEGYRAFVADDFTAATTAFAASIKLDPQVYTADDAAYLAARAEDLAGRPQEAAAWYGRVVSEFQESAYADDALYFGARAAERAGDRALAVRWYRNLLTRFPGSGYDWEAESGLRRLGE